MAVPRALVRAHEKELKWWADASRGKAKAPARARMSVRAWAFGLGCKLVHRLEQTREPSREAKS